LARVFWCIFLAGKGTEDDEGIAVFGRSKAFILKQGDEGVPVAEICRRAGSSQATYFNWKQKYAGMLPPEMKKLKQLDDETAWLKQIVADLTLDREMLQDVIRRKL
jgi:putative transposase